MPTQNHPMLKCNRCLLKAIRVCLLKMKVTKTFLVAMNNGNVPQNLLPAAFSEVMCVSMDV